MSQPWNCCELQCRWSWALNLGPRGEQAVHTSVPAHVDAGHPSTAEDSWLERAFSSPTYESQGPNSNTLTHGTLTHLSCTPQPGCPRTQGGPPTCLPCARIKGVCHYGLHLHFIGGQAGTVTQQSVLIQLEWLASQTLGSSPSRPPPSPPPP